MKFMLMMHAPRGTGDWSVFKWPPEDLKAHINFMKRFGRELKDAGELVAAEGLAAPDQARVVRATKGGGPEVIYWLSQDSVKLMRGHVNHKVEVTGTITDLSTGSVRVRQDPGREGRDNKVEVAARGKEATGKTEQPVTDGPQPTTKTVETKVLPVRRVKVETVKMIAATCP